MSAESNGSGGEFICGGLRHSFRFIGEIFNEPTKVISGQIKIDFQKPKKKGKKVIDNKEAANKIVTRLKKKFPWIEAKQLEQVFDEEG